MSTKLFRLCLLLCLLLTGKAAYSLTVDCPSLPEAVVEAKFIFDGTVIDKQARADMPNGKTVTLRMAGGSLTGNPADAETIPGLPHYEVDDRAILLMSNNGESMSPLVCWIFQYPIPRPDRLIYKREIVEKAWYTLKGYLVYKPSEKTLL